MQNRRYRVWIKRVQYFVQKCVLFQAKGYTLLTESVYPFQPPLQGSQSENYRHKIGLKSKKSFFSLFQKESIFLLMLSEC